MQLHALKYYTNFSSPSYLLRQRRPILFQIILDNPKTDTMIIQFLVDHGAWDVHILKAIEMVGKDKCRKVNMAMDVGANLSFFTNVVLPIGCQVTSFEIQPNMAQRVIFSACSNKKGLPYLPCWGCWQTFWYVENGKCWCRESWWHWHH